MRTFEIIHSANLAVRSRQRVKARSYREAMIKDKPRRLRLGITRFEIKEIKPKDLR